MKKNKLEFDKNQPCFIIAEAGVNHNGDFELAKKLVGVAKEAGVDAVKFQTFKAEETVTPDAAQAKYQSDNIGRAESQFAMLKRLELSYGDFRKLKRYCDKLDIVFMSTPHSCKEDVDLVAELCPAIKVGSGDLTNLPMLKYMASKGLPLIVSTGMATLDEVKEAVDAIFPINEDLIVLHCTTNYPTPLNEVNLRAMLTMRKEFGLPIGYSDHTEGINVSLAAAALGACVTEKHFTLDKKLPGPDHKASLELDELKSLVDGIRHVEKQLTQRIKPEEIIARLGMEAAMGNGIKLPTASELETAKAARKSIVAARDIHKGQTLTEDMLAIKRPGTGILPKHLDEFIGKTLAKSIKKNELLTWTHIGK